MEEYIEKSRNKVLVPDDKFDKHMTRARENTLANRRSLFLQQSKENEEKQNHRLQLLSSIY